MRAEAVWPPNCSACRSAATRLGMSAGSTRSSTLPHRAFANGAASASSPTVMTSR